MLRVLDLFAGIGGFSYGLERVGFRTVAFCEIDPYCRRVLARHWPDVRIYGDIRELSAVRLAADNIECDVVTGGFPCQDISIAGTRVGLAGPRSRLWTEMARLVGELRPCYVIVENVSALLSRGMGAVLGDLAALGYDAEWHCISAASIGAPHRRDRLWIIAYPSGDSLWQQPGRRDGARGSGATESRGNGAHGSLAYTNSGRCESVGISEHSSIERQSWDLADGCSAPGPGARADVADTDGAGSPQRVVFAGSAEETQRPHTRQDVSLGSDVADTNSSYQYGRISTVQMGWREVAEQIAEVSFQRRAQWRTEPDVGRVAYGIPARVDRLRALGNAIVPQIAEVLGAAILRRQ